MNNVWTVAWRSSCSGLRAGLASGSSARARQNKWNSTCESSVRHWSCATKRTSQTSNASSQHVSPSLIQRRSFSSTLEVFAKQDRGKPPPRSPRQAKSGSSTAKTSKATPLKNSGPTVNAPRRYIKEIFGSEATEAQGIEVLRILQHRRTTGELDQDLPEHLQFLEEATILRALEWVRRKYPDVDEDAAIQARFEREEAEMEENIRKYGAFNQPNRPAQPSDRGKLVMEQEARQRKWEAEEAKRKAEQAAREARGEHEPQKPAGTLMRPGESAELRAVRMQHYVDQATEFKEEKDMPKLSSFQRLAPTALWTLLVCLISYYASQNYTPPPNEARLFPDIPPAAATVGGLIAANVFVFSLWHVPRMWRLLNRYFIHVPVWPYTLSSTACVFSHQKASHLIPNVIVLWIFGVRCMWIS